LDLGGPAVTNIFTCIGSHRDDPDCLLLLGDDGAYYAYPEPEEPPIPVEPSPEWIALPPPAGEDEIAPALMDE
jgi:hypothetical protein